MVVCFRHCLACGRIRQNDRGSPQDAASAAQKLLEARLEFIPRQCREVELPGVQVEAKALEDRHSTRDRPQHVQFLILIGLAASADPGRQLWAGCRQGCTVGCIRGRCRLRWTLHLDAGGRQLRAVAVEVALGLYCRSLCRGHSSCIAGCVAGCIAGCDSHATVSALYFTSAALMCCRVCLYSLCHVSCCDDSCCHDSCWYDSCCHDAANSLLLGFLIVIKPPLWIPVAGSFGIAGCVAGALGWQCGVHCSCVGVILRLH